MNFIPYLVALFPIETYVAGFILDTVGFYDRREGSWDAFQYGFVATFFFQFYLFPTLFYFLGRIGGCVTKYMRMAEDELLAKAVAYVFDVEGFFLLAYFCIEDDMQEQVA